MDIFAQLPKELVNFVLVVIFALLIGLEQRRLHIDMDTETLFGTDRTITLIGILGFILYTINPQNMMLFAGGGIVLSGLLGLFYYNKIRVANKWGFTSVVIALITYCLAPLIDLKPMWQVLLIVVTILIVVEIKEDLKRFTYKFTPLPAAELVGELRDGTVVWRWVAGEDAAAGAESGAQTGGQAPAGAGPAEPTERFLYTASRPGQEDSSGSTRRNLLEMTAVSGQNCLEVVAQAANGRQSTPTEACVAVP